MNGFYLEHQFSRFFRRGGILQDIPEDKKPQVEIQKNFEFQPLINTIVELSLEPLYFNRFLEKTLEYILSVSWLASASSGSIYLTEINGNHTALVMKAKKDGHEDAEKPCRRIPFGYCLCGQAALSQQIIHAEKVDERHEICYEDIHPHGHYCVPILSDGKTLGLINLSLHEGHKQDSKEEVFLNTAANTLADIILYRQI